MKAVVSMMAAKEMKDKEADEKGKLAKLDMTKYGAKN